MNGQKQVAFDDLFEVKEITEEEAAKRRQEEEAKLIGAKQAAAEFAERAGASGEGISIAMEDIGLRLMDGGVVVDIDIHSWTGFKRLLPKEIGINGVKQQNRAIRLGEKALIPPKIHQQLATLTTQLRANLSRYAVKTVWGQWLSASAYGTWRPRHDQLVREYEEVGQALADNLDKVLAGEGGVWGELRRLYAENARAVWCRLQHMPVTEDNLERGPVWFVDEYISEIFAHMPSAGEIRSAFYVDTKISYIPLPSMLAADAARSDLAWRRADAERQADQARLDAETRMHAEIQAHYQAEKTRLIDQFLGQLAATVYGKVYDASTAALATIGRNEGRLMEPTIRQLKNLIDWAGAMNLSDHAELDKAIADLAAMVDRPVESREPGEVIKHLRAMGTVARSVLTDLKAVPEVENQKLSIAARDGVLGIGRRLPRAAVEQARQLLGTADIPELPVVQARRGGRATHVQHIEQV